jgi:hypothetical protein
MTSRTVGKNSTRLNLNLTLRQKLMP